MKEAPTIDRTRLFLTGSFGIFGAGCLIGVRSVLRREGVKLDIRGAHRTPFAVASRALMWGTALCFGTFFAGSSVFIASTGIKTLPELHSHAVKLLSHYDFLQIQDESVKEDIKRINAMKESEQAEYWNKFFTIGRDNLQEGEREALDSELKSSEEKDNK